MASYNTEAYSYMKAVVQAKETYEYAQAHGASTEDLLRLTAAASSAREWLNGHGYGWAASALGYSTATAAEASAWLAAVGKPRLIAEYQSAGGGGGGGGGGRAGGPGDNQDPVAIVPAPASSFQTGGSGIPWSSGGGAVAPAAGGVPSWAWVVGTLLVGLAILRR